jgi:hypothetical protein
LLRTLLLQRRCCKSIILERVLRQIGTSSTRSWEIRLSLISWICSAFVMVLRSTTAS